MEFIKSIIAVFKGSDEVARLTQQLSELESRNAVLAMENQTLQTKLHKLSKEKNKLLRWYNRAKKTD